jgi:hypothetical protein
MKGTAWIRVYKWNHIGDYFMWSDDAAIAVGGGESFGLYIYSDFSFGRSDKCTTFNNMPLTKNEFKIASLEIWGSDYKCDI